MLNTPVNVLAEQITNENFRAVFPCIKLLIQHGADVNIPNKREHTPITKILNSKLNGPNKQNVVRYLLQNVVEVDIDSNRNGEARKLLEKLFPEIDLPPPASVNSFPNDIETNRQLNFNSFLRLLINEREVEFLRGLQQVAEKNPETLQTLFTASEHRDTLLVTAVAKNLNEAVEQMLQLGADINFIVESTKDSMSPVKCACIRGHWRSLETLLKFQELELNSAPLLPIIVRNLKNAQTASINHENCFEMLLKQPNIDINQMDVWHCTALHYAVKFNDSKAIHKLLNHGAYIGVRNKSDQLSISNIDPRVLEKHFNNCITTNECRISDDNFEIEFDYKNLVPVHHAHSECILNEMSAIEYISKSNDLKQLMMHPLIASFLSLKWNRLALFFYVNFLLCAFFALITVTYILMFYNDHNASTTKEVMRVIIFLLTIYIGAREMYQFTFAPMSYLKSLENYLECTLVVLVMLILFDVCSDSWRRIFAATSILLIAIEIFLLAGSLPFWSFCTHYVMLKTVTWSFLKSLSLYAIILLAFSLSFFTLLHEPFEENSTEKSGDIESEDDGDGDFNKFTNPWLSLMKTLVMSTGEFDVASINFKTNSFSYFVFIIFLFLVSIVLLNLLNGLAVSDTQVIKSEAELTNFIRRAQVLARYECVLATGYGTF